MINTTHSLNICISAVLGGNFVIGLLYPMKQKYCRTDFLHSSLRPLIPQPIFHHSHFNVSIPKFDWSRCKGTLLHGFLCIELELKMAHLVRHLPKPVLRAEILGKMKAKKSRSGCNPETVAFLLVAAADLQIDQLHLIISRAGYLLSLSPKSKDMQSSCLSFTFSVGIPLSEILMCWIFPTSPKGMCQDACLLKIRVSEAMDEIA